MLSDLCLQSEQTQAELQRCTFLVSSRVWLVLLFPACVSTCMEVMFVYISIRNHLLICGWKTFWATTQQKKMAVYFLLATFPNLWEDMKMELDTNWLGQCRTASLCWLGRQQQVTLCNIALNKPHFPFSFSLRIILFSQQFKTVNSYKFSRNDVSSYKF